MSSFCLSPTPVGASARPPVRPVGPHGLKVSLGGTLSCQTPVRPRGAHGR